METVNHEYYISLEVAKLLRQLGFDWKLNSRWQDWGGKNSHEFILKTDLLYADGPAEYDGFHALPAPTLEVAQRWLREVRGYDVFVVPCNGLYFYTVRKYYHEDKVDYFDYPNQDAFDTYEKTLETGIKKALELILEQGK